MINMGMGGVPFDPPFTPWWDRLMNSQEQKQSVLSSDIPSSEICPPLMSISMAYYFLGVSTLCILDVIFRQILTFLEDQLIMFPWFMRARLHKLLIENSIHKQSYWNVTNYQKTTSIILIQLLGAIHIMGCEHTWLPLIYITTTNLAYMLSRFRR